MSTLSLLGTQLFCTSSYDRLDDAQKTRVSYLRARELARHYKFTKSDVVNLTPKFWGVFQDNISAFDAIACALLAIQINLVAGTILNYANPASDHEDLIQRTLNFDVSGQFMLTEVGHGLDARNLETTATFLGDEGFDLHTPHMNAAKFMPPNSPIEGFPRFGLVFAKLIVKNESRGIRPFIVWLNDGNKMAPGVTSKLLPTRGGEKPLDYSLTIFNHVRLPLTSLLGSMDPPADDRKHFMRMISRVGIGGFSIAMFGLSMLRRSVFVAGKYSLRRKVSDFNGQLQPIIIFRTQQAPILHSLAQLLVLDAFVPWAIAQVKNPKLNEYSRHGILVTAKALLVKAAQENLFHLTERCGVQGIFQHNEIYESLHQSRGGSIVEGDSLVLSIRLASELLLDRFQMPPIKDPDCLLGRLENSLFDEAKSLLKKMDSRHRSEDYNQLILPRCQNLIHTMGNRMAYEAAKEAKVNAAGLALFEARAVAENSAWFVEKGGISREDQFMMESRAMNLLLPQLEAMLDSLGVEEYCKAPILSDEALQAFHDGLSTFDQHGHQQL
ncbi:hypothetical protein CDD82_502 [Ophiocordyceps australis]|uniref:Acyl-CoA oxidase C-terminal domain-containing protein n=1 Tax=Ophiocordyceps australis TaxID=1399860 RepID=A0A2C5XDK2_9HYPO|nr:hypothetical protein CDD82_502 [Ophiocordyceps australis]